MRRKRRTQQHGELLKGSSGHKILSESAICSLAPSPAKKRELKLGFLKGDAHMQKRKVSAPAHPDHSQALGWTVEGTTAKHPRGVPEKQLNGAEKSRQKQPPPRMRGLGPAGAGVRAPRPLRPARHRLGGGTCSFWLFQGSDQCKRPPSLPRAATTTQTVWG